MAALASAAEIPPGGEGSIKATINALGRRGPIEKTVTVQSSDLENRFATLKIKANIKVDAAMEPRSLDLGTIIKGDKAIGITDLATDYPDRVKLTKVELVHGEPDTKITILRSKIVQGIRIEYTAKEIGLVQRQIKVYTTSSKHPVFDLEVVGHVVGIWEVTPRTISFDDPADGPSKATIKVTPRKRTSYKVLTDTDPGGLVTTKLQKTAEGYNIDLLLKEHTHGGRGAIELTTTDPSERTISVRYYEHRRPRRPSTPDPNPAP